MFSIFIVLLLAINSIQGKQVVYIGYWLSNANVPTMVSQLKSAGITHVLLTFIVQPDVTEPLTGTNYMLSSFLALTSTNQALLTSNFKVGVSLGGSNEMPNPYSNTFIPTTSYYYNNSVQYAQDYYNLVKGTGLENYFDLDIEMIKDQFPACATFIGNVCKELKTLNPNCMISHAPQTPYFYSRYGNVYNLIYNNYNQYFDWFNIQMYNNGEQNTFEQIFIQSATTNAPKTSVTELMEAGIDPSYIVIGKSVGGTASTGYVPFPTLTTIVEQAFSTPSLSAWTSSGGEMIWLYDSQNLNDSNNALLLAYFTALSSYS
jgi:hypothetical protein